MRLILTLSLIIITKSLLFGQDGTWSIDSLAQIEAQNLLKKGITNEVIVYSSGCTGCYSLDGNCQCSDGLISVYIIWKQNDILIKRLNCCYETYGKPFEAENLLNEFLLEQKQIFNSKFEFDYITPHDDFFRIRLLTRDSEQLIRMSSVHFDQNTEHFTSNMQQPAKLYLDKLREAITKAEKSGFTRRN